MNKGRPTFGFNAAVRPNNDNNCFQIVREMFLLKSLVPLSSLQNVSLRISLYACFYYELLERISIKGNICMKWFNIN